MTVRKKTDKKLGILVGGGPAPGINGVISAATIEAEHQGLSVIGFYDGFERLAKDDDPERAELVSRRTGVHDTRLEVSRIDVEGGSILRTSRHNPNDEELQKTVATLTRLGVGYLVTIGGDDTASSASRLADAAGGKIRVAHVPKTIDNDLPLPGDMPTFGYRTACELGSRLVRNLMVDAATMRRWFFVVAMGRTAGHLALGIGKGAGATLTLIPEDPELGGPDTLVTAEHVGKILEAAIYKRLAMGRRDGVAVISEGISMKLKQDELEKLTGREFKYDEHGHVRLGEFDTAPVWKDVVDQRLKEQGIKITITAQNIGYPLRCERPNAFDREYVRELGYAAVRFLTAKEPYEDCKKLNAAMIYIEHGVMRYRDFKDIRAIDPTTGKPRVSVRMVDVNTESYKVARQYMIRLEKEDLTDRNQLAALAKAANMTPAQFKKRFSDIVVWD